VILLARKCSEPCFFGHFLDCSQGTGHVLRLLLQSLPEILCIPFLVLDESKELLPGLLSVGPRLVPRILRFLMHRIDDLFRLLTRLVEERYIVRIPDNFGYDSRIHQQRAGVLLRILWLVFLFFANLFFSFAFGFSFFSFRSFNDQALISFRIFADKRIRK